MASPPSSQPGPEVPQDPVLVPISACHLCRQPMSPFRVYQGKGKAERRHLRGAIVQGCITCHWTRFHTPAYWYEDAEAFLDRLLNPVPGKAGVLRLSTAQPGQTPQPSPTRPHPPPPPPLLFPQTQPAPVTTFNYPATGLCANNAGRCTQRGNQLCVERLCKMCCRNAQVHAASTGKQRRCQPHKFYADTFTPATQATVNTLAPAPAPSFTPATQALVNTLAPGPAPAANPLPLPLPPLQTQPPGAAVAQTSSSSTHGRASLAQPISKEWLNVHTTAGGKTTLQKSRTVIHQELSESERRTVDIVVYYKPNTPSVSFSFPVPSFPKLRLQDLPGLMEDLELNNKSWIDVYLGHEIGWKVVNLEAVIDLEPGRPLLLRTRMSLIKGMADAECPDIDNTIARYQQRRNLKRQGQDLVSPLKKAVRRAPTPSRSLRSTSPPPPAQARKSSGSQRLLPTATPSTSVKVKQETDVAIFTKSKKEKREDPPLDMERTVLIGNTVTRVFKPLQRTGRNNRPRYPFDFAVCDVVDGLKELDRLKDLKHDNCDTFSKVFRKAPYVKTTLNDHRVKWKKEVSAALQKKYVGYGRTKEGLYDNLLKEVNQEKMVKRRGNRRRSSVQSASSASESSDDSDTSDGESDTVELESRASKTAVEAEEGASKLSSEGFVNEISDDEPLTTVDLCPFCDEPMPTSPSDSLKKDLARLVELSIPDPLLANPNHRRASTRLHASFCQRHEYERIEVPKAQARQWPDTIDFDALPGRVKACEEMLTDVMENIDSSDFFEIARKSYETSSGGKAGPLRGIDAIGKQGAAYYGERGYYILSETLSTMFPESKYSPGEFEPLTWRTVIEEVLLPETAIALIQEDRGVTAEEAAAIHTESRAYGALRHPIENADRSPSPVESAAPTVTTQQPKAEPVDAPLPPPSNGEVIDLTIEPKQEPEDGALPKWPFLNGEVIDLT
ncbi:hypothetical protein DFP72DRAFT_1080813 [Ephemerocybe angulata]|uniref:Restriction of telomere capping protein 4 n=1 Tax=Ephemerocybe angulata TaxID=980116 RepID=A0A8H6LVX9_9AGAR|nr:hypothetical protein DFP72DRAFT_1080813 [Tulosesus angulatus]